MKKILTLLMICFTCLIFASCGENNIKLDTREYNSSISNFYNDSVNAFNNGMANSLIAINNSDTKNHINSLKSGFLGDIDYFANFIPAVDYLVNIATKSGSELYAYNLFGEFKIYKVSRKTTSNAKYYLFSITLIQDNNSLDYEVKVEKKEGGFNVSCPKIKDGQIQTGTTGANIIETFQVFFEKSNSYLQIKNVSNISEIISYEMCFDNNNKFLYRRNYQNHIGFETVINTQIIDMKMLVVCTKSKQEKLEYIKITDSKFNYKTFAESSNLNVYLAKIASNGSTVIVDTYGQFKQDLPEDLQNYYAESLMLGEN